MPLTKNSAFALAIVAVGALSLQGCATQEYVDQHVAGVQSQVTTMQGQVQTQDARLAELDKTAHEALERAQAAGALADGKFVYSVFLTDDSIKFPIRSTLLSDEAKTRLNDLVQKLKTDNKNVYVEIQGYTDDVEAKSGHLRLGEERAEAVRRFMHEQGIALNRMSTISFGKDSPVATNKTRDGRAQNRRVVLVVLD